MDEAQVAEAVSAWAVDVVDELETGYAYPVATKLGALPDIVAVVKEVRIVPSDPAFPFLALEQSWLRVFEIEASVMVGIDDADGYEEIEAAHEAAHHTLESIGKQLRELPSTDADLGGRLTTASDTVAMVSPQVRTSYDPPFGELEDGTRGRFVFLFLSVAETMPEPG